MKKNRAAILNWQHKGISLIIVLILLVVIGLTAASAMRSATSSQRVTNNVRLDNIAQQYAESALRYCESQLQLPDVNRVNSLKVGVIPTVNVVGGASPAWENTISWTGAANAGAAAATRTTLPAAQYSSALSSYAPARAPECVAEIQSVGTPAITVTVVTARGFSPDYKADVNGNTTHGSVVWLQSIF